MPPPPDDALAADVLAAEVLAADVLAALSDFTARVDALDPSAPPWADVD